MGKLTDTYQYAITHVHDASAPVEQLRVNTVLEGYGDASVT